MKKKKVGKKNEKPRPRSGLGFSFFLCYNFQPYCSLLDFHYFSIKFIFSPYFFGLTAAPVALVFHFFPHFFSLLFFFYFHLLFWLFSPFIWIICIIFPYFLVSYILICYNFQPYCSLLDFPYFSIKFIFFPYFFWPRSCPSFIFSDLSSLFSCSFPTFCTYFNLLHSVPIFTLLAKLLGIYKILLRPLFFRFQPCFNIFNFPYFPS